MKRKNYDIDMCNGPLVGKMLLFAVTLMLSGILQILFNAVDTVVVGNYVGYEALAAVGSTSSLIFLLTVLFLGLSVGTNVLVARYCGLGNSKDLSETVYTSVAVSLICGVGLTSVGVLGARPFPTLMGTPANILNLSVLYMRVYFLDMPAMLTYNLGAAVLCAVGDTRRPLYFLIFSGGINVLLNLLFVLALRWSVAGSALAPSVRRPFPPSWSFLVLIRTEGPMRLRIPELRVSRQKPLGMLRIGIPAGIQGIVFSLSNVLIQSSINSFGSVVVAGSTAAANIEGFVTTSMNAFHQTTVSFPDQNYGAHKYSRIVRTCCSLCPLIWRWVWCLGMAHTFSAGRCWAFIRAAAGQSPLARNAFSISCSAFQTCRLQLGMGSSSVFSVLPDVEKRHCCGLSAVLKIHRAAPSC